MKNTQSLFFAFLLVLTASCQSSESPYPASGIFVSDWPDIRQLYRNLREHGNMLVVYPTGNEAVTEAYRSWAEALARDNSGLQLKVMADRQVSREDLQREALLLVGSPESNSLLREILPGLPLRMEADKQITIGRQTYRSATAVVTLPIYPNPLHPRLPIAVYTGFDDRQVLQALPAGSGRRGYPIRWGQFGYEIREEGRRVLMGQFDWESWEIDPELVFDFSREAQQIGFRPPYRYLVQGEHFASEQAEALMSQADECARQIAHFTDKPLPAQPVSHFIYPSAEIKGLMTGNTRQSHLDISRREVHSVLNETYRGNWSGAENELLLRLMIGRPKTQVLEQGLALYFTPGWQVKGYRYWASRLYNSGNLLSLEEVLEEGNQVDASRLLIPCLAASFVEFLLDHWGRERFLELYPGWDPGEQEIRGLEKRWHAYLADKHSGDPQASGQKPDLPFLKGFNFAHEGYSIYNGYISQMAGESLGKMLELGSNAVAIVPYSFMRDPQRPVRLGIPDGAGSENDESVIHSTVEAQRLGLTVVLKPQIWLGGGSWPGDVQMQSEEDWQQFFRYYHRWMLHYALMAEMRDIEVLCIGTEFARATLERPQDWRRLVNRIDALFSGHITYAANWGEEFEQLSFWDEFDFIGLNCYYPLGEEAEMSVKALENNFRDVSKRVRSVQARYDKPVVITEIGFRSIQNPWDRPYAEPDRASYSGEHQRRCYEAVFRCLDKQEWCRGILWWKFPSYLDYGGRENLSYTPYNKPAERVVRTWFDRLPD